MPPKIEIGTIVKVTKTDDEWKRLLALFGIPGVAARGY